MKLFIVIYFGSLIGGSVGPLPYGMEECADRVAQKHATMERQLALGVNAVTGAPFTPEQIETANSLRFVCEWRDGHPPQTYR